jgi:hypothetical protein
VNGRPVVAVVLKNVHHLRAVSSLIRDRLVPALETAQRPFHLLVLDDEADDGSILDARVDKSLNPALDDLKQIPRAIVDLWEKRPHTGETASPNLFTTYIGYTATPQANFLQSDHNPLAPTDFALGLRTPFDQGELIPRSTTYKEPLGPKAFFTGGESFYNRLEGSKICTPTTSSPNDDLLEALRAFLVAGAIRLWRDPDMPRPSQSRKSHFDTREQAKAGSPKPHSMLFHPSASISDHFEAAATVLSAACGLDLTLSRQRIQSGDRSLPVGEFGTVLSSNEDAWCQWLGGYRESATAVETAFDLPQAASIPSDSQWAEIRALLLDEVIPFTQLKVVNSDAEADEPPQFDPVQDASGRWHSPPDLSTIFVSGNVMSRGLTLEGLTTTLFLRSSDEPLADTQMQMQRWFGYRGSFFELCRVFLTRQQLNLFRAYHDADEALRRTVISAMNEESDDPPSPFVLGGGDFYATGKLTNVTNVPLCPGASPFVRLVNSGEIEDPNAALLARTFSAQPSEDVNVNGLRGRILLEPCTLIDAADLLDELQYDDCRPPADGWEGMRWTDIESKIAIDETNDSDSLLPFFRPPPAGPKKPTPYIRGGPYAISAYMRLWKACLTRKARGLVPTDDSRVPWSMLDLTVKTAEQPRFYVGIRYGGGNKVEDGPLGELPFSIMGMKRAVTDGQLEASWGSRSPGSVAGQYFGDELFDYHFHGGKPPTARPGEPAWRPVGAPGLILFHVIERPDALSTVAVGIALPLGGPDQFAARKPSST